MSQTTRRGLIGRMSGEAWIFLGLVVVALTIAGSATGLMAQLSEEEVTYDGEFGKFVDPDHVLGTDLNVTDQTLNSTGDVDDANVEMAYDINGTNGGKTNQMAWGFTVTGDRGFSSVEVSGGLASGVSTDELKIDGSYIVPDEDGNTLSDRDAVYTGLADGTDSLDHTTGELGDGQYVFNADVESVDASSIGFDADLLNVELEGDREDSDEHDTTVDVTVDNRAADQ